jgi:hypothetical protein
MGGENSDLQAAEPARGPESSSQAARRRSPVTQAKVHWWVHPVRTLARVLLVVFLVMFAGLAITGRPLPAPDAVTRWVESRANAALGGVAEVRLGGIEALVERNLIPRIGFEGLQILSPGGGTLALVEGARASFDPGALLRGRVSPKSLRLSGVTVALRRDSEGRIDLPTGVAGQGGQVPRTPLELLDAIDRAFEVPVLAGLDRIEVERVAIRLDDQRTGRRWDVADGKLTLDQTTESIAAALGFDLAGPGMTPARGEIDFISRKGSAEARMEARVRNVSARDLADQSPALAWLSALDAPISGSFRTAIDEAGVVGRTVASLSIGEGAVRPTEETRPIAFRAASLAMNYDPERGELAFDNLSFDSAQLRVKADGKAWVEDTGSGSGALVAQIRMGELWANPEGVFSGAVTFGGGGADLKVDLDPFSVRIGEIWLENEGRRITASGRVTGDETGWNVALDAGMDRITSDRLLALWPIGAVPKTRAWLKENVATAELTDVRAALRMNAAAEPLLSLGYSFASAEVRFLKSLPPVRDGRGYATIDGNSYTMVLDEGHVIAPKGGRVEVDGSVLEVPDIRQKPAPARVTLRTESGITAALSLLDEPPFKFLAKAGREVDLAEGRARLEAVLDFALKPKLAPGEVGFRVTGELTDVTSDRLVPGRDLVAGKLTLNASQTGLEISGKGTLSGVAFDASWSQRFAPEAKGRSRVAGAVELSQQSMEAFGIALPRDFLRDSATGLIALDIETGKAASFRLTSDLVGARLALPGIGWSKPAGTPGALTVEGTLGPVPDISRLDLAAAGLTAKGRASFRQDGGLDRIAFAEAALADVYSGAVDVVGQGRGKPVRIEVRGGTGDLRNARFSAAGPGGSALPIAVRLDRLSLTDGIALTRLSGDFSTGGGFNGQFRARVNDAVQVEGTVVPMPGGAGVRLRSDNAGAALRASGILKGGAGGTLEMTLQPAEAARAYDGRMDIKGLRVTDAPVLAELLGVISVVGLLEQLNGQGILFSDVQAAFRLSPDRVTLREASAVGASMGVSAAGEYLPASRQMSFTGTISPIYLLNGIGQVFTRRREGLFGFNYRMTGTPDDVRVAVNPLSILTPGMFRDLFRAPPPKVAP